MNPAQVKMRLQAALEGVVPDPAAFVDDLDVSRFVDEAGEPLEDAITVLAERYRAMTAPPPRSGRE